MIHYHRYDDLATTLQQGNHAFEVACCVGLYYDITERPEKWYRENQIVKLTTTESLFGASNPTIGSAVSRSLSLQVYVGRYYDEPDVVVWSRSIWLATRLVSTDDPNTMTPWYVTGPWYEQNRSYDPMTGVLTINAYDSMADSDSEYMTIEEDETNPHYRQCFRDGAATAPALEVFRDIAEILNLAGVTPRAMAAVNDAGNPDMQRPDDSTTMRDIIRWVAGICGGNAIISWHMTTNGMLDIVPFNFAGEIIQVGTRVGQLRIGAKSHTTDLWDVCFETDDGDVYSTHLAPGQQHTQRVTTRFQMQNPLGTTAIADHALSVMRETGEGINPPWQYTGFSARDALLDIRAEAGDLIQVLYPDHEGTTSGFLTIIGEIQRTYDRACVANVSAPDLARKTRGTYEIEDE